ncbi:MAG: biotin--[acetyl-CoA-carboxylase] ligase, partial [Candidatus Nitrosomaritimum aestuariumsis]
PVDFVQAFLLELEKIFEMLNSEQIKKITKEWTKRSSTIGKNVELATREGKITGKALRIDNDGALVIADKKNTRVLAGDIVHLK